MLFKRITFFCSIAVLLFIANPLHAQQALKGSIKGFVYDKTTGEPSIYTNVYLYKTSMGATTDVNGFFAITQIPPGEYILMSTFLGYDTIKMPITINKGDNINQKLYLQKAAYDIKGINISADAQDNKTETKVSELTVTPKKIEQIPSIGGTPDLAQYLQVMPGVIFTGDQGGQPLP